jgi:signal transduction histidine kinase
VETTLKDVLVSKGMNIIESVERLSRDRLSLLSGRGNGLSMTAIDPSSLEAGFSIRESIAWRLMDLAREIDLKEGEGLVSQDELRSLAAAENLRAIALFDDKGKMVFQSSRIPETVFSRVRALLEGREEIGIELVEAPGEEEPTQLVGLRRMSGKGTVLILLDGKGFLFWASRVVIQDAVEEGGWRKEVVYFRVEDSQGRLLAGAGEFPETGEQGEARTMPEKRQDDQGAGSRRVRFGSSNALEVYAPMRLSSPTMGEAKVGLDMENVDDLLRENRFHVFLSVGLMMGIGLVAMWLLYRNQNQHLSRLEAMRERLNHAERLSSMGQLAGGVAHEIRNPLNAISMATQRLQREYGSLADGDKAGEFHKLAGVIRDEIRRLDGIVSDFLSLSRRRFDLRAQSMVELLEKIIHLIREEAATRNIAIETQWEVDKPLIYMDADKMKQAVINIIKNGLESMAGHGTMRFFVLPHGKTRLAVRIEDTGAGIPARDLEQIFNPHYTTKEKGLGLGLSIAYEIVRAHGGDLRVKSEPGKGTTFEILLPFQKKGNDR